MKYYINSGSRALAAMTKQTQARNYESLGARIMACHSRAALERGPRDMEPLCFVFSQYNCLPGHYSPSLFFFLPSERSFVKPLLIGLFFIGQTALWRVFHLKC